jgi:DNA invertase Pin-like site-specific DNA recombinase
MTAIGYIRRSTKSDERTVSLEGQARSIEEYCVLHNLDLALPLIEDDGVSGGDDSRLDNLLEQVRAQRAAALVVYHDDRLARSTSRVLDFIRTLSHEGVAVHLVSRGLAEVDTSEGLLTTGVHALLAEYHRLVTSEKTRAALSLLKSQGRRYCKVAPYGKRVRGRNLIDNSHELKLLGRLRFHAQRGLSIRGISIQLAAEGFRARAGNPLAPSTIHKLIRRELR